MRALFPITPPDRLFSRAEVLQRPSQVPVANGLYAWYFREAPSIIPTDGCPKIGDLKRQDQRLQHHISTGLSTLKPQFFPPQEPAEPQ